MLAERRRPSRLPDAAGCLEASISSSRLGSPGEDRPHRASLSKLQSDGMPTPEATVVMRSVASSPLGLRLAVQAIAAGQVVAYPTEAVYGLGCDPLDAVAVRRILAIKRRPERKGLILIAAEFKALRPFVLPLEPARMAEIKTSWPGANTWLLPARPETPSWLTGEHETIAVRIPSHPVARALCKGWAGYGGGALVSTSANIAERPPARTALEVRRRLPQGPDLILNAPCGGHTRPSVIRDARTGQVLRT